MSPVRSSARSSSTGSSPTNSCGRSSSCAGPCRGRDEPVAMSPVLRMRRPLFRACGALLPWRAGWTPRPFSVGTLIWLGLAAVLVVQLNLVLWDRAPGWVAHAVFYASPLLIIAGPLLHRLFMAVAGGWYGYGAG